MMKERKYEAAASHFARVLELGDRGALVYTNHVLALLRTSGREEEVEAALKAALARHPGDAQIQQLLDRYVSQARVSR